MDEIYTVNSVNGVPIRLTPERWFHIVENHDDLAGYFFSILEVIEYPDFNGTLKASKNFGKKKWLIVIYREVSKQDGFIITSYFVDKCPGGEVIWKQN